MCITLLKPKNPLYVFSANRFVLVLTNHFPSPRERTGSEDS